MKIIDRQKALSVNVGKKTRGFAWKTEVLSSRKEFNTRMRGIFGREQKAKSLINGFKRPQELYT